MCLYASWKHENYVSISAEVKITFITNFNQELLLFMFMIWSPDYDGYPSGMGLPIKISNRAFEKYQHSKTFLLSSLESFMTMLLLIKKK